MLHKTTNINNTTSHHTNYGKKNLHKHPAETVKPKLGHIVRDIGIYTDALKLESGATVSAFVAYKHEQKITKWSMSLKKCKRVCQT